MLQREKHRTKRASGRTTGVRGVVHGDGFEAGLLQTAEVPILYL